MKDTLLEEHNLSRTENGALGYRTNGKELLDLNFAVSSLRRETPLKIQARFWKAYYEDPVLAVKWLFFARDIRGGMGERRLFRVLLSVLANEKPEVARPLLPLVPEYGRWDDLWSLLGTPLHQDVLNLVSTQWKEDLSHLATGDSVSLLAKWLPSPNASAKETKYRAKQIYTALGLSERGLPEKSPHPPRKTGRGRETDVPKGLGRHPVRRSALPGKPFVRQRLSPPR